MARPDEAKAALRAIYSHADLLIQACLEDGGQILENSDTAAALQTLRHHRLIFELDVEQQSAQVNRVVSGLIHHVTQSYRRQLSCAAASGIVQELESIVEGYKMAWRSNSNDLPTREAEAQECVASLIDTLREITQRFTRYIHTDFSYVSDLEQRIHENRRALKEANDLNQVFDTLTPRYLEELAGPVSGLQRLLLRTLRRHLAHLRTDLVDATHGLRENLSRLEKDEKALQYSHLIDAFLCHYEQTPNYQPDAGMLEGMERIPPVFCGVDPLTMRAEPDISDVAQHEGFRDLLAAALKRSAEQVRPQETRREPVKVRDKRKAVVTIERDPFNEAMTHFFEALPLLTQRLGRVSAMDAYYALKVEKPVDVWLMGVFSHHHIQRDRMPSAYRSQLTEVRLPLYDGNFIVSDIVFTPEAAR